MATGIQRIAEVSSEVALLSGETAKAASAIMKTGEYRNVMDRARQVHLLKKRRHKLTVRYREIVRMRLNHFQAVFPSCVSIEYQDKEAGTRLAQNLQSCHAIV